MHTNMHNRFSIAHFTAFHIQDNHAHNQQAIAPVCSGKNLCPGLSLLFLHQGSIQEVNQSQITIKHQMTWLERWHKM